MSGAGVKIIRSEELEPALGILSRREE
jgi:hypothetical protein